MSQRQVDHTWLDEAKDDVDQWALICPKDADERPVDWQWVRALDLSGGIGVGTAAVENPQQNVYALLKRDYAVRDRVEAILAQTNTAFMTDFDRLVASYRLPRALAYANRRLNDEINLLLDRGEQDGLWKVRYERQGRVTVPVLHVLASSDEDGNLDEIQDRTATILDARAERRKAQRAQHASGARVMGQANLSGATSPSGGYAPASDLMSSSRCGTQSQRGGTSAGDGGSAPAKRGDWRDVYLPGRDVDTVMGIDIETTGTDPARVYIIDVGFEFMNMASPRPADEPGGYVYEQPYYQAGDAYGQARLSFGVTPENARHGNALIRDLTGIDVRERGAGEYRLFDEWPEAQTGLLARLTQQPYVAHNATFEHGFFMLNVAGYAEAYRAGRITIIDTLPMSRQWDPGSVPDESHPYGDNTLDAYAKRQGALDPAHDERHLGLEDAHIMLVAMKHHLAELKREGKGPWGADGKPGTGGKACGRRRW